MSSEELELLKAGRVVKNSTHWMGVSDSEGFCFFPEIIKTYSRTIEGEDMQDYLEGNYDYVVTLKPLKGGFKRGIGRYEIGNRIEPVTEYSRPMYSLQSVKIVKIEKL
jgi:hypothetical protein